MSIPTTGYDSATISNPDSSLTDFTLLIDLSRMSTSWKSAFNTNDNGRGRVCKSDGSTELACDWIDLDNSAGTGLLRVKYTGTLASTGTQTIRVYPPSTSNPQYLASDTYGSYNAYDGDWEAYYPDAGTINRTANSHTGTAEGGVSVGGIAGKVGNATYFDGTDDDIDLGLISNFNLESGHTIIVWIKRSSTSFEDIIAARYGLGNILLQIDANFNIKAHYNTSGSLVSVINTSGAFSSADWEMGIQKYDGTNLYAYIGTNSASTSLSGTPSTDGASLAIASRGKSSPFGNGSLNEVQIHSTARSDDWISEEYDQTNSQSTFWGIWTWNSGGSGGTIIPLIMNLLRRMK